MLFELLISFMKYGTREANMTRWLEWNDASPPLSLGWAHLVYN